MHDHQLSGPRLALESGEGLEGRNGRMDTEFLVGETLDGDPLEVALADVVMLEKTSGSHMVKGLATGAAIGAGILIGAILSVTSDETSELDESKIVPVGLVLVLGGGGIGAAIGSAFPKWEEVPLDSPAKTADFGMKLGARFSF